MKILIIEDEYSLADALSEVLKRENYNVTIKTNGEEGENEALTGIYNLILLDVMLPDKNGFDVLNELKKSKIQTPIIMLTAKSDIKSKVNGLENGADDYITKPFYARELLARIKIALKRTNNIEDANYIEYGDLKLDIKNAKLFTEYNDVQVNGKELELIEQLLLNKDQVSEKEKIVAKIWGYDSETEYNNIEVYISFLRKKLLLINSNIRIKSVRGIGYKLEEKND